MLKFKQDPKFFKIPRAFLTNGYSIKTALFIIYLFEEYLKSKKNKCIKNNEYFNIESARKIGEIIGISTKSIKNQKKKLKELELISFYSKNKTHFMKLNIEKINEILEKGNEIE